MEVVKSRGFGNVIGSTPSGDGTELEVYEKYISLVKYPVEDGDNDRRYNIRIGESSMDPEAFKLSENLLTLEEAENRYNKIWT